MSRRSSPLLPASLAVLLIAAVVFAPIACAAEYGWLLRLELLAFDLGTRLLSAPANDKPNVLVVGVTEDDIHKRRDYPVSDESLAAVLEKLEALHPSAIGVDIYRDFPIYSQRDIKTPDTSGPDHLNKVLAGNPNIVMIWKARDNGNSPTPPPEILLNNPRAFYQIGFDDMLPDADGVFRQILLAISSDKQTDDQLAPLKQHPTLPSLELSLALPALRARNLSIKFDGPDKSLDLNGHIWPALIDGNSPYVGVNMPRYCILADFLNLSPIPQISFSDCLLNQLAESDIKGRVILIGGTAPSTGDLKLTPLGSPDYGVVLHARAVDQLIRAARGQIAAPRFWTTSGQLGWLALWIIAGSFSGLFIRGPIRFGTGLTGGLALLALVYLFALHHWLLIPLIAPALGWAVSSVLVTAYLFLRERNDRNALTRLFVTHVDRAVFDVLWDQRDQLLEEGRIKPQRAIASILFTDLKGFSAASETMTADELMQWLNEYMEEMSSAITLHHGVILKYIGDSIMAAFGIPLSSDDPAKHAADAIRCVEAALEMRRSLARLNARWQSEGRALAQMRVGIFTGPLVVGSLGSEQRLEYTCVGESVNTASRLESYDKSLMDPDIAADGCRILISEKTAELVQKLFSLRAIGKIELHNISSGIKAFGVIDRLEQGPKPSVPAPNA